MASSTFIGMVKNFVPLANSSLSIYILYLGFDGEIVFIDVAYIAEVVFSYNITKK